MMDNMPRRDVDITIEMKRSDLNDKVDRLRSQCQIEYGLSIPTFIALTKSIFSPFLISSFQCNCEYRLFQSIAILYRNIVFK